MTWRVSSPAAVTGWTRRRWPRSRKSARRVQVIAQQFQQERNAKSKAIGAAKSKGEDTSRLMQEVADTGAALKQAETELEQIQNDTQ